MITLVPAVLYSRFGYAQQARPGDINSFFHEMIGEWIGTFDQSTDRVNAPTKYFHALAKQTGPDSYETSFEYYEIDPETRKTVDAGASTMSTRVAADGTGTNTITGKGEVLINAKTLKPELHQFSEILRMSSPGVLQGTGSGSINVGGKDGKVVPYTSTWSICNGVLQITQEFNVKFKVLLFSKTYSITMDHTIRRGNDIMSLIRKGAGKVNSGEPCQ